MNQFLEFVRKEFLHIFRDGRTMLILLVMPIVLIILFGYAITNEVKDTRVAILDESKDPVTERVVYRLAANRYFTVTRQVACMDDVYRLFRQGDVDMALCFGPRFSAGTVRGDASLQILVDGIEPNQANLRSVYAMNVLMDCRRELAQSAQPVAQVAVSTRMLYNPQSRSEYNFVPGVIGMIILLLCTLMTSISIVREKEMGTMEVLLASPLPPLYILLAKLVPYFVVSVVNLTTILLLATLLLHVPIAGSLLVFAGVSLLYILVALSLGLFISTCVGSQLGAMLLSLLMIVPTVYFSGMVFPVESMPDMLQHLSVIVPARWFIDAARRLMIQGVEPSYVARDAVVLAIMLAVLLTVSLKLYKKRL